MTAWSITENEDGSSVTLVHEGEAIGTVTFKWARPAEGRYAETREYVAKGRTVEVKGEHGINDIAFSSQIASGGAAHEQVAEYTSASTLTQEA